MKRIAQPFSETQPVIPWRLCPKCNASLDARNTTTKALSDIQIESQINRGEISHLEDWGFFTATNTCASCHEIIHVAGRFDMDLDVFCDKEGNPEQRIFRIYRPQWMSHFPILVETSASIPKPIHHALERCNPLFWVDTSACATALRSTIEIFLDQQPVARIRSGTNIPLGLEERIEIFVEDVATRDKKSATEYETFLRAPKFIGNDGTHGTRPVEAENIRLACDCIERVLKMRYPEEDNLLARAASIARHPSNRQRKLAKATPPQVPAAPQQAQAAPQQAQAAPQQAQAAPPLAPSTATGKVQ